MESDKGLNTGQFNSQTRFVLQTLSGVKLTCVQACASQCIMYMMWRNRKQCKAITPDQTALFA